MIVRFQAAAEAVGAVVGRFSSVADAAMYIRRTSGPSIAASDLPEEVHRALSGLAFAPAEEYRNVRACVSFALAGIAATGCLLLELSDPVGRSATALPPIHMVFLRSSSIAPDLPALAGTLETLLSSRSSSYLSLTTGPSRTADIERVLTIGVHGPKELHILILEGD
jgi:L-lactate dehydrogenase complex protein LldG